MQVIITKQLQFLCSSDPLDATVKYILYTNTTILLAMDRD